MVRLEKILYEQLVNNQTLRSARAIAKPSKWYREKRNEAYYTASHTVLNTGLSGAIFRACEPIISFFTWKWWRDIAKQRGFAMEDFFLHQDRELRRDPFWEKLARDNLHPYQWIFFKRRRARYYKVERGLRGFYVPDWAAREGQERIFSETVKNRDTFDNFLYQEYMSDQTPSGRFTVLQKLNVLDLITVYGPFRADAWDTLFYNEAHKAEYSEKDYQEAISNPFGKFNFSNPESRRQFEREVNRFISLYPGTVVREGESFDFNRFYAQHALANNQDVSQFDGALINQLKNELVQTSQAEGSAKGGNGRLTGTTTPAFLRERKGTGLF